MNKKLFYLLFLLLECGCSTLVSQIYYRESRAPLPVMSYRSEFNFTQNEMDITIYPHYFEMNDFLSGPLIPFIPTFGFYYDSCCGKRIFKDSQLVMGIIIESKHEAFTLDFSEMNIIIGDKKFEADIVQDYDSNLTNRAQKTIRSLSLIDSKNYKNSPYKSRLASSFIFSVKNNEVDSFKVDGIQLITEKGNTLVQPLFFKKEKGIGFKFDLPPG